MVKGPHIDQLKKFDKILSEGFVFWAWGWVSRWVIVNDDDVGSIGKNGVLDDFSGIDNASVDGPGKNLDTYQLVFTVQV